MSGMRGPCCVLSVVEAEPVASVAGSGAVLAVESGIGAAVDGG